jgi:hypothetical protein
MFEHNRVFSNRNTSTGRMDWFCETREGEQGPFESEQIARAALEKHIEYSKRNKLDGGRVLGLDKPMALKLED